MAHYILSVSPTYRARVSSEEDRRRAAICARMTESYKMAKTRTHGDDEVFRELSVEFASERIEFNRTIYAADKRLLRIVYLWLNADESEKASVYDKAQGAIRCVIDWFIEDGLTTFTSVLVNPATREAETGDEKVVDESATHSPDDLPARRALRTAAEEVSAGI